MYNLKKKYDNFMGLDLTSSDIAKGDDFSSGMINADHPLDDTVSKRKGHQKKAIETDMAQGLVRFRRINPITRQEEDELLLIGDSIKRVEEVATLNVTYSGPATTCTATIKYDETSGEIKFQTLADGVLQLNITLNQGFDEASTLTVAQLATLIDAHANYVSTATGTTSQPAAFIDRVNGFDLKAGALALTAGGLTEIPTADLLHFNNTVFQGFELYENPSFAEAYGCLYVAGGERLLKYDGQSVFWAGMSKQSSFTSYAFAGAPKGALTALATAAAGEYKYRTRLIYVDNAGNRIVGPFSDELSGALIAANQVMSITYSGTNVEGVKHSAKVNGAAASYTVTVDSGHTLVAGDRVFSLSVMDSTGEAGEWFVTATTATTVTLSPSDDAANVPNFADNTILSTMRMEIYRTKKAGAIFYFDAEIPWVEFEPFLDNLADTSLIEELEEPAYEPEPPPPAKYVTVFQNTLVLAGAPFYQGEILGDTDIEKAYNTFYWADLQAQEGFPSDGSHQADVAAKDADYITGVRGTQESLMISQNRAWHRVAGDLGLGQITVEEIIGDIGCVAHHTIQEVNGMILFLSERGPAQLVSGLKPDGSIGMAIRSVFAQPNSGLSFKRAIAFVDKTNEKYILFVPSEGGEGEQVVEFDFSTGDGTGLDYDYTKIYANSSSRIFVFDARKPRWLEWSGLNMAGGIASFDGALWWAERAWSNYSDEVVYRICKQLNLNHANDYEDHNQPVDFEYATSWNHFAEPKIQKQYLRLSMTGKNDTPENAWGVDVEQECDFVANVRATMTLDLADGGDLGCDDQTKLLDGKFKAARFRFKNSEHNQNVEIMGWELEVNTPFKPELKK